MSSKIWYGVDERQYKVAMRRSPSRAIFRRDQPAYGGDRAQRRAEADPQRQAVLRGGAWARAALSHSTPSADWHSVIGCHIPFGIYTAILLSSLTALSVSARPEWQMCRPGLAAPPCLNAAGTPSSSAPNEQLPLERARC
jgi:hypothetical protein